MRSLPRTMLSSFNSLLNHWLILFLAWVLLTRASQSRLGPLEFWEVMTSMRSPFWTTYSIGTSLPFTLAPTILLPTALWMEYAKSMVVEPLGSVLTSPDGVKQYTFSENKSRSPFTMLRNSLESLVSFCHSRIWRSQDSFAASSPAATLPLPLSLYFQCAAIPYSAVRCISKVLIWISNGWPLLPISVVCRDWYIFGFGMAI